QSSNRVHTLASPGRAGHKVRVSGWRISMVKKVVLTAGLALVLLIGMILFRTVTYGGTPAGVQQVTLPDVPPVDADRAARRLGEAIQFKTITRNAGDPLPGDEGPWLDLQAWMAQTYPTIHAAAPPETLPGGYTLLFTWQGSNPDLQPVLLMAHQDVVPVAEGTEGDWDAPPFSGTIRDGYVYGRGAIDDKGSMVALLEAMETLAVSGFQPQRTVILMLGHDEEVAGSGAATGVETLRKRGLVPVMALDEGFVVVRDNPLTGGTVAFIGVAEKGYMTLRLTVTAEGGHSSMPPRDSATVRLAKALVALDENQMPANMEKAPVSTLFEATAPDMPFAQRAVFANRWLFGGLLEGILSDTPAANAMIRTTTAPTMLNGSEKENVLAQRATAVINFRIHPNDTEDSVLAHVERVTRKIDGLEVEALSAGVRGTGASVVSPIDNRAYGVLAAVAAEASDGAPVAPGLVPAATDARYANRITDSVYRFLPAVISLDDLDGVHGTNERLEVANMGRMTRGYMQIITAMDAADADLTE
ncbi:MAG: M20 family peptidase, partial [Pseudomonadota bacterium]